MVRVRVAGGTLTHEQTQELAALATDFGNGLLHVTTRQDVQLHAVAIEETPRVMRRLMRVGLTSKGGGGNTVRNVTACPYAGICPNERILARRREERKMNNYKDNSLSIGNTA